MEMRNAAVAVGLALIAGCGGPSGIPDGLASDPAASRLKPGTRVLLVNRHSDAVSVMNPGGETVFAPVGAHARVESDDRPAKMEPVQYLDRESLDAAEDHPSDHRRVRVYVLDGRDAGVSGEVWRFNLRSEPGP